MQQSLIDALLAQKQKLVEAEPRLSHFFVDIEGAPFLPIGCFRHFHVFQNSEPPHVTFLSSGSTNDTRARHSFSKSGLERYQKMSNVGFKLFLASLGLNPDVPIVSLVPPPGEWPQSSLSAMIDMFKPSVLPVSSNDVVIFGTSIHHLLAESSSMFDNKNVVVIDTGGTKGRTRNFSTSEVYAKIRQTYANAASCRIVSEYGMCELTNQAWSFHEPHDGWFRANPGLTPCVVDLDKLCFAREGFLAFIDEGNQDSFMGIITEDLATMDPSQPDCFKLIGRAPDASQKGCSLNVRANFISNIVVPASGLPRYARNDDDIWDKYARADLDLSLASVEKPAHLEQTRLNQRILMILSANIPITFLYPTFMCFYRGAQEVCIQLPSTRANDPISERVREQIKALVEEISPMVAPMRVNVVESRDVSFSSFNDFDAVLVFGTDETLATFAEHTPKGVELIGLGAIQNAVRFDVANSSELAQLCSRWLGRGCLSPIAVVAEETINIAQFAREFDTNFSERLLAAGADNHFAHRHRLLEIAGFCPDAIIYRGQGTFVIDLRGVEMGDYTISAGGAGLVYVISQEQAAKLPLSFYNPQPGFFDEHQGKVWSEWI